jgi:F420-dependent oxidoreductase-like protein
MRIGSLIDLNKPIDEAVEQVRGFADAGFASAWASQIFGYDALSLLALIGREVPGIELGTAVVPVYPRHPQALAQQALTVQAATANRLTLGIGLSHQLVVEGMWGYTYEKPARYMREYLTALVPMLHGEAVNVEGEVITAHSYGPLEVPGSEAPPLLVAALGSVMLGIAGRMADGTVTWMTGVATIEHHIAPAIAQAAATAGRPPPRVVVSLPVTVTTDPEHAKERIDKAFALYPNLPSYKAMLDKEGAERPSDIALVGTEEEVGAQLEHLAVAGSTDFVAAVVGNPEEKARSEALLVSVAAR